ncbi:MAG: response regulator [Betaproteobacteria bacterium]|nr:response regulator [Betaproteobacteria bacterium]
MTNTSPESLPVILVVDDTPQHLSIASDVLEGSYTVKLANNGKRGLKIAATAKPDLILLDIMMPEMDGFEVCQQLKADPATRHIPIIFLTASEDAETEQRGLDIGAVDYITKPISPPVLLARVRNHLALRRHAEELEVWNRTLTQRVEEGIAERQQFALLRQELDVARQIQTGLLPLRRPLFPDRLDLEIAGIMEPASAVGGDLFDAFFVDERTLFFCIGDVSGHGIAAAMFMARAFSLMRLAAFETRLPEKVLGRINDQLVIGNDANMFVTLVCGFFEVGSGRLTYSNGGHLAPVLYRDGVAATLPLPRGTAIGILEGVAYRQHEIVLDPDDLVLCFTDGVTEASSSTHEEYSEPRLINLVEQHGRLPLEDLLDSIRTDVAAFTGSRELEDDCTMLALRLPSAR